MKRNRLSFLPAIAWFIISAVLLTIPGSDLPQEDWLDKIWFDKWVHIGMFGILVTLWCLAWRSLKISLPAELKKAFIIIGIIGLLYGISMEFVQKFWIPFRSFDVLDILADGIGCTLGVVFSTRRYIKK